MDAHMGHIATVVLIVCATIVPSTGDLGQALPICEKGSRTGTDVEVRSDGYSLSEDYGVAKYRSCHCSITTSDTFTTVWTFDTELDCGGSPQNLSLTGADGMDLLSWKCNDLINQVSNITNLSNGANLVWTGQAGARIGKFWIGFQASGNINITVRCSPILDTTTAPTTSTASTTARSTSTLSLTVVAITEPSTTIAITEPTHGPTPLAMHTNTPASSKTTTQTDKRPISQTSETTTNVQLTPKRKPEQNVTEQDPESTDTGLIAGLCVGIVGLIIAIIIVVILVLKHKKSRKKQVGPEQNQETAVYAQVNKARVRDNINAGHVFDTSNDQDATVSKKGHRKRKTRSRKDVSKSEQVISEELPTRSQELPVYYKDIDTITSNLGRKVEHEVPEYAKVRRAKDIDKGSFNAVPQDIPDSAKVHTARNISKKQVDAELENEIPDYTNLKANTARDISLEDDDNARDDKQVTSVAYSNANTEHVSKVPKLPPLSKNRL